MQEHPEEFQALQFLGSNPDITDEERSTCTRFISMMYGQKCDSLNAVRCKLAQSERRQIVGKKLPPTDDSFFLNVLRAVMDHMEAGPSSYHGKTQTN